MQDRYLFRGKRIDNGEWIIGSLLVDKQQDIGIGEQIEIIGIYPSEYKDFAKKIDPSTICQCTGLNDKNGNLIWENDVLSGHIDNEFPEDETRKRVVWYENGWCTNEPGCDDYEELDDFDSENFEVIGNMIDNPELLEAQP